MAGTTLTKIPGLTGLRGIGAIMVMLYHLNGTSTLPVIRDGYAGVDLFFILSGFVLSHAYRSDFRVFSGEAYARFLVARVARIYPLHLAVLAALAVFVAAFPAFAIRYDLADQRWSLGALFASALLVQNWAHFLPTCWNAPAWSLSAEVFAYLLFPVITLFAHRFVGRRWPIVGAAACLGAMVAALTIRGADLREAGEPGMLRMLCEFTSGTLLYRAVESGIVVTRHVEAAAVALLVLAVSIEGPMAMLMPFAFAAIVLSASQTGSAIATATSLPIVLWLGEVSYSIYAVHWVIIQIANWRIYDLPVPVFDAIVIGTVLVIAALAYRYVERPARSWGRRIVSGMRNLDARPAPSSSKIASTAGPSPSA
jgi:peptidoglycan/LPS O-acetylase OafA/YrhL